MKIPGAEVVVHQALMHRIFLSVPFPCIFVICALSWQLLEIEMAERFRGTKKTELLCNGLSMNSGTSSCSVWWQKINMLLHTQWVVQPCSHKLLFISEHRKRWSCCLALLVSKSCRRRHPSPFMLRAG